MKHHFITVEGNIGAGKTTLSHLLAKHYNARLVLEEFADNPFLAKFYEQPQQYAFPVELFFMAERYKQLKDMVHTKELFDIIHQQLVFPDIIIYLHAPVQKLQQNIRKRNRPYELNIPDEYLFSLQETYTSYIKQHNITTIFIDASNADFLGNPKHLQVVIDALEKEIEQGQHYFSLPE
jgi:deoxyguanosine kinase